VLGPIIANPGKNSAASLLKLAGIGALSHTYACTVNDIADCEEDRLDPRRAVSPLVSGDISLTAARISAALQLLTALALTASLHRESRIRSSLCAAVLFGSITYSNARQKSGDMPPQFMDALFGANLGSPAALAALSMQAAQPKRCLGLSSSFGLQMFLLNAVAGNLKDLEHDRSVKAFTTALNMGARIRPDGTLDAPKGYRWLAIVTNSAEPLPLIHLTLNAPARRPAKAAIITAVMLLMCCSNSSLYQLLSGHRQVSTRGRERYLVFNYIGLIASCLPYSPAAVATTATATIGWVALCQQTAAILEQVEHRLVGQDDS